MGLKSLFLWTRVLELSCKANAIEFARIAEPQPIMSKKSTRYVGAFVTHFSATNCSLYISLNAILPTQINIDPQNFQNTPYIKSEAVRASQRILPLVIYLKNTITLQLVIIETCKTFKSKILRSILFYFLYAKIHRKVFLCQTFQTNILILSTNFASQHCNCIFMHSF